MSSEPYPTSVLEKVLLAVHPARETLARVPILSDRLSIGRPMQGSWTTRGNER